jgi:hypothetical protein
MNMIAEALFRPTSSGGTMPIVTEQLAEINEDFELDRERG